MLLKISVRICPSFWYQMALSRVLAHGLCWWCLLPLLCPLYPKDRRRGGHFMAMLVVLSSNTLPSTSQGEEW